MTSRVSSRRVQNSCPDSDGSGTRGGVCSLIQGPTWSEVFSLITDGLSAASDNILMISNVTRLTCLSVPVGQKFVNSNCSLL